jgi:hypothetical protein
MDTVSRHLNNLYAYRGTSLIRNSTTPRNTIDLYACSYRRVPARGALFLMSEVALYTARGAPTLPA